VSFRRRKGEDVTFMRGRRWLAALALVVLAAAALAASDAMQSHGAFDALHVDRDRQSPHALQKGDPDAQDRVAGNTVNLAGPDSYAAEQLANLAYPSDAVTAQVLDNERSFYTGRIKARAKISKASSWQLAGPQTATEPAVLNFFDLQASSLQESGRITALAVDPAACDLTSCRVWIAAAGGGVWRTDNALAANPSWTFLSGGFGTNAIGTLTYDAGSHTLYAGTGEPNASGDSESGVGIYASQNGGTNWTFLSGSAAVMRARSISSIVVDPAHKGTLYVGTTRGVRGVSAVTGGAVSLAPDAAPWGLYKTTDGGQTFTKVWDGHGTPRGVNHVELDGHATLYASAFQQGIWRSSNGGSTWEQVFATQDPANTAARTEFALNATSDGHTRIYVGDGGHETDTLFPPHSNTGVYRGDAVDTKTSAQLTDGTTNSGFVALTDPANGRADPTYNYCHGQCWYDNYVVSPAGHPDLVYVGGSFDYDLYGYPLNDGRAVLLSQDAGKTWTDQTRDAAAQTTGIHPDQHALVVDPANPLLFFEGSDGGIVRSSGQLKAGTTTCLAGQGAYTTACQQLVSSVPTKISTLNAGLSTLQFQGIASRGSTLIGGTQDNGTWLGTAGQSSWNQTIYGDGGVATFDKSNSSFALNEFFDRYTDGNFANGDPTKWVVLSGPFFASGEASAFYKPQIGDPAVSGTFFVGVQSVWRTQDFGGDRASLEANCPEFSTPGDKAGCGDFVPLGDSAGKGGPGSQSDLTGKAFGKDRAGGVVAALARTNADHSTLWAATSTGRVFVSANADGEAGKVAFTRIDNAAAPNRFVSGIVVDPTNANRAWITYTGYNANTPSTPGHVFQVDYNAAAKTAAWTDIDNGTGPLGDLPVTAIARDSATGTLYVGTDFAVLADAPASNGTFDGNWRPAADGMPEVEIADLKIDSASHTLYAGTHGRAIWSLSLQ
jgi:hypothetical protein